MFNLEALESDIELLPKQFDSAKDLMEFIKQTDMWELTVQGSRVNADGVRDTIAWDEQKAQKLYADYKAHERTFLVYTHNGKEKLATNVNIVSADVIHRSGEKIQHLQAGEQIIIIENNQIVSDETRWAEYGHNAKRAVSGKRLTDEDAQTGMERELLEETGINPAITQIDLIEETNEKEFSVGFPGLLTIGTVTKYEITIPDAEYKKKYKEHKRTFINKAGQTVEVYNVFRWQNDE